MPDGPKPATARRLAPALAGAGLALALAAAFFLHADRGSAPASAAVPEAREPVELTAAEVLEVRPRALVRRLPVSGTIASMLQTTVRSKVPGEVLEVAVREGEPVRRGEVLARIDTRSLEAEHASARAALDKAGADLEIARLNHENALRLFGRKVIAQNELDTRRSLFESARASRELAAAQLRLAAIALEDAVVRAPFDGVVSRRHVHPGGRTAPDGPLFDLVDLSHMELQAAAPASEIPAVRPGQVARVRVDGYGAEEFEARLERVNPSAEQGSRLVLLYLTIDNADGRLRDGMFAQGALLIEQTAPVLAVPETAVVNEAGFDYVMAIEGGRLARLPVRLGAVATEDGFVEVREGLAEGARVLAVRLGALEPGTPVVVTGPAG